MITNSSLKTLPNVSSFMTYLITYINRIIIVNRDFFMNEILQVLFQQGLTFKQFLTQWFKKMDFITSRESLRINLIAIYYMIPFFQS